MNEHLSAEETADRINSIVGVGYASAEKARQAEAEIPGIRDELLPLLRLFTREGNWGKVANLSNVAVHLHPEGLGEVLADALRAEDIDDRAEDLVEILGELRYQPAADAVFGYLKRMIPREHAPYYAISVKCVQTLGALGTPAARKMLSELTSDQWPDPVRWHAAFELGTEAELGFDEDSMLGGTGT